MRFKPKNYNIVPYWCTQQPLDPDSGNATKNTDIKGDKIIKGLELANLT